jgi:uncharacterized protein YaiL (DUF2058 family)
MADSLRDQLLKSGIVKQVRDEKRVAGPATGKSGSKGGKSRHAPNAARHSRSEKDQEGIDLARAYAIRAQAEASERKRAEQEAAEQSRLRRERKQKIQKLLEGSALNKADADQPRNFEFGGKIRRVHVDAEQLVALNTGALGVVQHAGRYLLVPREIAEQVRDIEPRQLALLITPGANGADDDGVPDDLMW